jgi:hypothetical protein
MGQSDSPIDLCNWHFVREEAKLQVTLSWEETAGPILPAE